MNASHYCQFLSWNRFSAASWNDSLITISLLSNMHFVQLSYKKKCGEHNPFIFWILHSHTLSLILYLDYNYIVHLHNILSQYIYIIKFLLGCSSIHVSRRKSEKILLITHQQKKQGAQGPLVCTSWGGSSLWTTWGCITLLPRDRSHSREKCSRSPSHNGLRQASSCERLPTMMPAALHQRESIRIRKERTYWIWYIEGYRWK